MQFLKSIKYNNIKILGVFLASFLFLSGFTTTVSAQKKYTIVLDAGHGGKDPGNLGNGFKEKKIALRVALDVGKELSTAKDVKVVYTRKKDVFVELHNRAKKANDIKADLFVSIHCDAFNKSTPHGAGTFVLGLNGNKENLEISKRENSVILLEDNYKQNYDYDPNSPESVIGLSVLQEENLDNSLAIAGGIQGNFSSIKRFDRKVKQANFLVLRETVMPSVLVELGFLTNKAEGNFLNSRKGQLKMAKAIAAAIKKYVKSLQLNTIQQEVVSTNKPVKQKTSKKAIQPKKKIISKTTRINNVTSKKASLKPVFKIQIAASRKQLSTSKFTDLKNVSRLFIDNYYKYYTGNAAVFNDIKKQLVEVRRKGYKDAWIVAFKNGQRISIKQALKNQ